jgi:hypothetical protein
VSKPQNETKTIEAKSDQLDKLKNISKALQTNSETLASISVNPQAPTGLEAEPKDSQYDLPAQLRQPLIPENQKDADDINHM